MEGDDGKQPNHKEPCNNNSSNTNTNNNELFEQENFDYILAISLQEQEGGSTYTTLATIVSEDDEEDDDADESSLDDEEEDDDSEYYLESQDFEESETQFLEGEGSNYDDEVEEEEMEEDEIDPDEMSYEELLELGEIIGEENRGLSENEVSSCLYPYTCKSNSVDGRIDRCVVCQLEYEEGESMVALECKHPFHEDCITTWLQIKKVCPICGNEVSTNNNNTNKVMPKNE
ncbi:hypothetical protein PIB30_028717 [Stylosanthes scabra]|uniref:RING-type domain-containing protein n=1 Tax=Stylosanthes scabra TaxID=79078 RepID=A0ABU6VB62_9FABA|nr:hypothetical protein [Stylosanthes scabra]